jgi:putative hydrolase of HD superfamily
MDANSDISKLQGIFDFLYQAGKLKKTLRFSQSNKHMPKDSAASHTWRLTLMAFTFADQLNLKINVERALKISIVHDLCESITGDIDYRLIAQNKFPKEEKEKIEKEAIIKLKSLLPDDLGEKIYGLWQEYQSCSSREAKFIKALDKLETLLQIIEAGYKAYDQPNIIPVYADNVVKDFPELKEVLKLIKIKLRDEFKKGNIPWKEEYNFSVL